MAVTATARLWLSRCMYFCLHIRVDGVAGPGTEVAKVSVGEVEGKGSA